jgi:cell division protein ZapA (FtsZ GTPase activity inhibitor)
LSTTIKILGKEYRVRGDSADPVHLERVCTYLDGVMREVQRSAVDTQDAAILAALNIASELLLLRETIADSNERVRALIDLVDSI